MSAPYHFDCVFYYVSDVERATQFYQDVLGFTLTSRDVVARFDVDGVLFELVPTSDAGKLGGAGNARLALRVDDIRQAVHRLNARSVPTTLIEDKGTGLLAFFRDPDNNEICLWQYT